MVQKRNTVAGHTQRALQNNYDSTRSLIGQQVCLDESM